MQPALKSKIFNLIKKPFVRNVALVASGTAIAQVITMAFAPVITRLYGPEAFGMLGTFMAIMAVLAPVAALTYPIAIVLPKKDSEAAGITVLSIYIAFGVATLSLIVILVGDGWIAEVLQISSIRPYLLLVPLFIVLSVWLQVKQQWAIRKQLFQAKARVDVFQALFVNGFKSSMGLFAPFGSILIIIATLGKAIHALMLKHQIDKRITKDFASPKGLSYIAKKHIDFPKYRAPLQLINNITTGLPIIILSAFFGPAQAGYYALCRNVLNKPADLIGLSVADVLYPNIADKANNKIPIFPIVLKTTISLAGIGAVVFSPIIIWGPQVFSFVFGEEWLIAGEYARWISLWMFFVLVDKPSIRALPVISAQKFFLILTTSARILAIIIMIASYKFFKNDLIVVASLCCTTALFNFFLIVITFLKSRNFDIENS